MLIKPQRSAASFRSRALGYVVCISHLEAATMPNIHDYVLSLHYIHTSAGAQHQVSRGRDLRLLKAKLFLITERYMKNLD